MKKEEFIKKGLLLGIGLAAYAEDKAEALAAELIKKGHLNPAEGKKMVRTIRAEVEKSGKRIAQVVKQEANRIKKKM